MIDTSARAMNENQKGLFLPCRAPMPRRTEEGYDTFSLSLSGETSGLCGAPLCPEGRAKRVGCLYSEPNLKGSRFWPLNAVAVLSIRTAGSLSESLHDLGVYGRKWRIWSNLDGHGLSPYYRSYWAADILANIREAASRSAADRLVYSLQPGRWISSGRTKE